MDYKLRLISSVICSIIIVLPISIAISVICINFSLSCFIKIRSPFSSYYFLSHVRPWCCASSSIQKRVVFSIIIALLIDIWSVGRLLKCHLLILLTSPKSSAKSKSRFESKPWSKMTFAHRFKHFYLNFCANPPIIEMNPAARIMSPPNVLFRFETCLIMTTHLCFSELSLRIS